MKVKEILTEGLSKKDTFSILHDFVRFAAEDLNFDNARSLQQLFKTVCISLTDKY